MRFLPPGGSGIGRALASRLSLSQPVLIIGRRKEALQISKELSGKPENVHICSADISTTEGRALVVAALPADVKIQFLVHNAGSVEPIVALTEITLDAFRSAMACNVEAPLFLSQGNKCFHSLPYFINIHSNLELGT